MKKTIHTLICLFYLFSSIGYASIEHYCHAMHERSANSGDCCFTLSCRPEAVSSSAQAPADCCAGDAHAEQNEQADEALSAGRCCENINSYHQIDEPTTRESNPVETSISDEPSALLPPDLQKWISFYQPLNIPTDPSFQLNLPLLN